MKKQFLGNSQLEVPIICLGTMTWGEQNSESEAHEQLDYALANEVNFIDTAELYAVPIKAETSGLTETYIGNWLKKTGKRSEVTLATKMAGPRTLWIREGRGLVAEDIEEAVNGSLRRLQTNIIDLYQLHWPQRPVALWGRLNYPSEAYKKEATQQLENFYRALVNIYKSGKVRYFGLSNETPWGVMTYQRLSKEYDLPPMVSVQNAYSLIRREYEVGLSEISLFENIGLLAYSPLAGGLLTGKYRNEIPPKSRYAQFPEMMGYYSDERVQQCITAYTKLAEELGISLTTLSLAFVSQQPFVHSTIIGATTMEQLKVNIDSAKVELSKETLEKIDTIFKKYNPGNY